MTRSPIPRKREKPRRKRPELFFKAFRDTPWPVLSRMVRQMWWRLHGTLLRCGICKKRIWNFEDMVPDHIIPGKMGGCKDNSLTNLQPAHWWCNLAKGSRRDG